MVKATLDHRVPNELCPLGYYLNQFKSRSSPRYILKSSRNSEAGSALVTSTGGKGVPEKEFAGKGVPEKGFGINS